VIRIHRRPEEPDGLEAARERALDQLRIAARLARTRREDLPDSYNRFRSDLHDMQHRKCCYCEQIEMPVHNDAEHFRPISIYPWLAWTWSNLYFACRACNQQGGKADKFPLVDEAARLGWWAEPPGEEQPLLVDPCLDDPREHIEFVYLADRGRFVPQGQDRTRAERLSMRSWVWTAMTTSSDSRSSSSTMCDRRSGASAIESATRIVPA